jgi:hypothetical protein
MSSSSRWILGFDASCGRCTEIANMAKSAAGDKLEVIPLMHPEVQEFRTRALGENAPWTPTLIRVDGDVVRAWTGPAMGVRLFMRLGPWAATRLCLSLGDLARASRADESEKKLFGRRGFLRFGAGIGIAAGIVLTGRAPALADEAGRAAAWVAANKDRLPKTYDEFSAYNLTYRRAIYRELEPAARRRLWAEHVARFRRSHSSLTPQQAAALEKLDAQVAQSQTFRIQAAEAADPREEQLRDELIAAFGEEKAIALVAVLGPAEPRAAAETSPSGDVGVQVACECSRQSDYCSYPAISGWVCSGRPSCTASWDGCGWLWRYACDGMCTRCSC